MLVSTQGLFLKPKISSFAPQGWKHKGVEAQGWKQKKSNMETKGNFIHLQHNDQCVPNQELNFGGAQVVLSSEESKASRKASNTLRGLEQFGIFESDFHTKPQTLVYKTAGLGQPGLTFVLIGDDKGKGYFVHPRVFAFEDGVVTNIPDVAMKMLSSTDVLPVISGTCQFGANGAKAVAEDGTTFYLTDNAEASQINKPIKTITAIQTLHPYEMETMLRLTDFLRCFGKPAIDLDFHLPEIEYLNYGIHQWQMGFMDDLMHTLIQSILEMLKIGKSRLLVSEVEQSRMGKFMG